MTKTKFWIIICVLYAFLFVLVGCGPKVGMADFVDVVHNHRTLTNETSNALILSIQDELEHKKNSGSVTPEEEQALSDLVERLRYMSRQSDVIGDYVDTHHMDDELLSRLLRSKWKGE